MIRTQKAVEPLPVVPLVKPFKTEAFLEKVTLFQEAMTRYAYELFAPFHLTMGREFENILGFEPKVWPVPLELTETDETLMIHADLPGFKEEEIEVRLEPKRIYIGGQREEVVEDKNVRTLYSELNGRRISRWFELPTEIEPDKVKATLKEGVLEITLPKAQVAKKVRFITKAA